MNRHPGIKVRWTSSLEECRARALNSHTVHAYFEVLRELIITYNIPPENIYNMDEKGVLLGVIGRIKALFDRDQKTMHHLAQGT